MENRTIEIPPPAEKYPSLREVMDDVASKAKARGLTPEILDVLLKGD